MTDEELIKMLRGHKSEYYCAVAADRLEALTSARVVTDEMVERSSRAIEAMCYGMGDTKRLISLEIARAALEAAVSRPEGEKDSDVHPLARFGSNDAADLGLYRVHWKSGGAYLAAIGMMENGDRWIAPTNWDRPGMIASAGEWGEIERLEPINVDPSPQDASAEPDGLRQWREDQLERVKDGSFLSQPASAEQELPVVAWREKDGVPLTDHAEATRLLAEARAEVAEKSGGWVLRRAVDAEAEVAKLREALEPFALIGSEGLVGKPGEKEFVTVTTQADYFHDASAAISKEG